MKMLHLYAEGGWGLYCVKMLDIKNFAYIF